MIVEGRRDRCAALVCVAAVVLAACSPSSPPGFQGYVEGEFVAASSPIAGRLVQLRVKRGDEVTQNAPLFSLDAISEAAALRQAQEQARGAGAQLADLRQGKRAPEQDVTRAQLSQAQIDEQKSATQLARDEAQFKIGGISQQQLDDTRASHAAAAARQRQLQSELVVAALPSRGEQIKAQAAQVAAANAAVEQAQWRLDQKTIATVQAGRVFDTPYREGEWVAAGNPVVRLLPPANIKVRFFVPEPVVGSLAVGRAITVHCDGCAADVAATVSYISTEAEFTPPIIYSNETRAKLVYMIEARPAPDSATKLNPGQPVNVRLQ
jgi:HlyD family secretion protein